MKHMKFVMIMIATMSLSCFFSEGHSRVVEYVSYSCDNSKFISFSGSVVFVWGKDGSFLRNIKFKDYISSVSSNDNLTELIVALDNGKIIVYDVEDLLIINSFDSNSGRISKIIFYSNTIIASSWDGKIRKWNKNGTLIDIYDSKDPVYCFAICDKYYVIGNKNGSVKLFDHINKKSKTLYLHNNEVNDVFISKSSNYIVTCSIDGRIIIYNVKDKKMIVAESGTSATSIVISGDEKLIVSGSWDNTIKIWDISGKLLKSFTAHSEAVTTLDMSSDDKYILSGSYDKDIKIWSINGELIKTIGLSKMTKNFISEMWNID